MTQPVIFTKFVRPKPVKEKPYGEKVVETAGYIPAKKQIENLIMAGERLEAFRAGLYDFPEGIINENFEDPTRNPDFDIADASQLDRDVTKRIIESDKKAKEKKEAEDAEKEIKAKADAEELEEFRKEKKNLKKTNS